LPDDVVNKLAAAPFAQKFNPETKLESTAAKVFTHRDEFVKKLEQQVPSEEWKKAGADGVPNGEKIADIVAPRPINSFLKVVLVLLFSVVGMGGSYCVAWYGIRVNTYANCRTAFAALKGEPWDVVNIPLRAGMSIGLFLISLELIMMVIILLF